VHLNTWEAVYFNHDLPTLTSLATAAAAVGIERYVLDDGWFHGRRNDTAGLGDWWVDTDVWPMGLTPLIDHVRSLGMEFGLWFEPEMVNPDSDLFREHPEWALHDADYPMVLGRNQLVLNMAQPEVREYLFGSISAVLSAHDISYVKWDHNRPLVGGAAHAQTLGTYQLFSRLNEAFPHVEFESCASGGGRVDMGIAPYVERFWTSDSIDALDRVSIQRGFSMLMPPEVMGAHIGGPVCHTTGRRHTMSFRAATAMFGWLGVEWNILDATDRERERLAEMIALHKRHRALLHSGLAFRGDHSDPTVVVHGVVAIDNSEALVNVTRVESGASTHTAPVHVPGLNPNGTYEIHMALAPAVYALHRAHPDWMLHSNIMSMTGAQLANIGINMPALMPESAMVLHLIRTNTPIDK
jgi:alpha-galactosidase